MPRPMSCTCTRCASGSTPCSRARAVRRSPRPVSISCRPARGWTSAVSRRRTSSRIRERRPGSDGPVSVKVIKPVRGLHNAARPGKMAQRRPARGGYGLAPGRAPNIQQAQDLMERPRLPSGQDVELVLAEYARTLRSGATVNAVQTPAYDTGLEARFAVAARHSRMVRVLRVAVPAAVALSLGAILLISIFNPFHTILAKLPVGIDNIAVSGTKITMETPHLAGYT